MERKLYNHNSAIVGRDTNLATVHSRVTVGGWSTEFEYKLLRQFTTTYIYMYMSQSLKNVLI